MLNCHVQAARNIVVTCRQDVILLTRHEQAGRNIVVTSRQDVILLNCHVQAGRNIVVTCRQDVMLLTLGVQAGRNVMRVTQQSGDKFELALSNGCIPLTTAVCALDLKTEETINTCCCNSAGLGSNTYFYLIFGLYLKSVCKYNQIHKNYCFTNVR